MTKKLKLWLAALVMGVGIAAPAQAAIYNIGDLSGPAFFFESESFASGTAINDTFQFTVSAANTFVAILQSITLNPFFNISGFQLNLSGPGLLASYTPGMATPDFISSGLLLITGGAYSANIVGTASGSLGGIYQIQMATAPIPEPSEWMMMLAGLILVGFMVKRRSELL